MMPLPRVRFDEIDGDLCVAIVSAGAEVWVNRILAHVAHLEVRDDPITRKYLPMFQQQLRLSLLHPNDLWMARDTLHEWAFRAATGLYRRDYDTAIRDKVAGIKGGKRRGVSLTKVTKTGRKRRRKCGGATRVAAPPIWPARLHLTRPLKPTPSLDTCASKGINAKGS